MQILLARRDIHTAEATLAPGIRRCRGDQAFPTMVAVARPDSCSGRVEITLNHDRHVTRCPRGAATHAVNHVDEHVDHVVADRPCRCTLAPRVYKDSVGRSDQAGDILRSIRALSDRSGDLHHPVHVGVVVESLLDDPSSIGTQTLGLVG